MYIEVPGCRVRMIDSINCLPSALSELPKMFGLEELKKGYFPHLFNRKENQSVELNHLPDVRYYNPDAMKLKDRKAFFMWYETNYRQRFDFQRELLSYCRSDVDILRRACLTFRQLFLEMTSGDVHGGIDPFQKCITIASACNLVFRTKFLRPDTIGIIPAQGYRQEEKHSIKAMQWIKYLSTTKGVHIQHARNGGEKEIGHYKVDGYYENENGQKYVLEFNGKFWHGCLHCYNTNTVNPVNGMTMGDLYQRTIEKKRYLEGQGYVYVGKWECEFDREIMHFMYPLYSAVSAAQPLVFCVVLFRPLLVFFPLFLIVLSVLFGLRPTFYLEKTPYGRPSCTLFRFRVVIMTTLDHAVEEECRRILLEEGREGGGRRRRRDKFHVFMSAVKMARLVNLISHYVVDIS